MSSQPSSLGSLAQSARGKNLKQARWILIVVGLMTIGLNSFLLYNAPNEVKNVIDGEIRKQGGIIAPAQRKTAEEQILMFCYVVYGGTLGLGVVFVILGIIVYQFPVPATVAGLVLYIAANAVFAVFDPAAIVSGIIVKIVIVVLLFKAVQSAIAYQKDAATADLEPAT